MARNPKAIVLDSWSVIAYLEDEPAAKQIAELIANAHEEKVPVFMSVVNVGEVWYILAREVSEKDADQSVKQLRDLRIQFEDVNWGLAQEAARFKSKYKMSYADCFAAALAREKKADLVTGDNEFRQLQNLIKINWISNESEST